MTRRPSLTWHIEETHTNGDPAVGFRRPWEKERITVRALDSEQVRADLQELERIDGLNPGWYLGFLIRNTPVEGLDGLWAQYPGVVVVNADRPCELARLITAAHTEHGLQEGTTGEHAGQ
ncbi:hypothetical protein Q8791_17165 [Nocardiopsis sp. CT-R113]|uniref:Uncharacterized protein n=1 Tax=Nocardiopsis codii TaxID=3065942 RepID=A0ABU7K9P0_9ACTN|nr:hypothetical protein [Nocardiopsis sp. CT-R113]MEE2038950.1 hypothetical protein [Nocardiopsis sp. CT-R113]